LNSDAKLFTDNTCLVEKADDLQLELKLIQNLRLIHEWTTAKLITGNQQKSPVLVILPKQNCFYF